MENQSRSVNSEIKTNSKMLMNFENSLSTHEMDLREAKSQIGNYQGLVKAY